MEQLKQLILSDLVKTITENLGFIKIVLAFMAYSGMEYWFGKTDRVKEGSFMEFCWARIKGLFSPSKGVEAVKPEDKQ